MKEITIDGEIYVLKSDIKKEKVFTEFNMHCMDENNVMAMGSVKLNGNFNATKVSIDYLEKAIDCIKRLSSLKKGREEIVIVISEGMPIGLGDIKGDIFSGVIVAPRDDLE